jgi:ribosomal-protein-alanine N-acetyltransferase
VAATSIRLIDRSDSRELATALAKDRQEYARWLPARPDDFYTPDGQELVITALLESHDKGVTWPGVITYNDQVVGQVTLSSIMRGPFQKAFIGYWISSSFQGRGHSHRAVELAVKVAGNHLGLHRLEAHTQVENLASQAILRKNGFRSWGIAHEHFFADGAWRDEIFWERRLS